MTQTNPLDRIRAIARTGLRTGRSAAGEATKVASRVAGAGIHRTAGVVTGLVQRHGSPEVEPPSRESTPATPAAPPSSGTGPARTATTSAPHAEPTPADVAKRVARKPPAARKAPAKKAPPKKASVPGAKLPPRRPTETD